MKNGPRDRNVVQIKANGKSFSVVLRSGEERSVDVGAAFKPGDTNTLKLSLLGRQGRASTS